MRCTASSLAWSGVVLFSLAASAAIASAQPTPSDELSEAPFCVRATPSGRIPFDAQIIGIDGTAVGNSTVRLIIDATACPDVRDCMGAVPTVFFGKTDSGGNVSFPLELGGCCEGPGVVELYADPGDVRIRSYDTIGSTDNDADGLVWLPDFTIFQAAFLTDDSCNDLVACDEFVAISDFAAFQFFYLDGCP